MRPPFARRRIAGHFEPSRSWVRNLSFHSPLLLVTLFFTLPASAQVVTGTPPFGSLAGGPDVINLASLNAHIAIPVLRKPGRGTNFTYDLSYDSSVWYPVGANGSQVWTPAYNWGWRGVTEAMTGYVSYHVMTRRCFMETQWINYNDYTSWVFHDAFGGLHGFLGVVQDGTAGCATEPLTFTSTATDGSGFTISVDGSPSATVTSATGTTTDPPLQTGTGAGFFIDRNGNELTADGSGHFYDALSSTTPVLTASGTAPNPTTFAYTAPSGVNAAYMMKYTAYTVQTSFGCSGINEYGPTSNNLVSEIDLPDGSKYLFNYEPTPGASGNTTGRLASVTLPTGGTISYAYSGGNNGIVCADGSTATLSRTTPDSSTPWTYVHSESGTAWNTLVTDPLGNQTNLNFQGIYETQRQVYQGSAASGTLLRQWTTCYNGNASNCNGTAITLPITQRTVTDQYGSSGLQCQHIYKYNSVGGLTEQDDYDYGSGGPGTLLRQVLVTYASLTNITAFRQQVTIKNGSGTILSQTNYNYDETTPTATSGIAQHTSVSGSRGNLTSINYPVSGLTSHFTYYDTGSLNTSQDVNGATTTYNYANNTADCQMAFPTSVSEPLSMSRSMTWNCTGGVPATSTDENSQATTTTWSDASFWRPASVSFPDGGLTSWTYNSQTSVTTTTKMNSSQNIVTTQLLDGLGRSLHGQLNSDPEGVDYTDATYDALGRVASVSNPYRSTSDPTYGITSYQYDTLSRPTKITLQDGSVASASYSNNTVTATDPAGKTRTTTYDSLGRLTQVNEDPNGLNYVTTYSYDALSNLTGVTQNGSRQRSYAYDAMSRLTSETNPESSTVNYGYDASGHQGDLTSRVAPAPNQTGSATVTTTYSYDALHRLTQKSYSDGTTPTATFTYDISSLRGVTIQNPIGRLVTADTSWSSGYTYIMRSYDPLGRVGTQWQWFPARAAKVSYAFQTGAQYNLAGSPTAYSNETNWFYLQYDFAGRPTQLTSSLNDSQHPATLATADSSVGYYPHGASRKMMFGNGLTQAIEIESRLQSCEINLNSSGSLLTGCGVTPVGNVQDHHYGFGSWASTNNGSVTAWIASGTQNFSRSYGYDSVNRLSTLSSPSDPDGCTGLSWTYDPWGNRTAQTVTGGSCFSFSATVNANNQLSGPPYQYDAAGNLIADGSHTYTYDAENRLISVDGGSTASYIYDAEGHRAQKTTGGVTTAYVQDIVNGQVIEETDGSDTLQVGYSYMNGQLMAEYKNGTTYFAHPDHLGSTRLLTGMNQSVVQNVDYLPFGEAFPAGSSIPVVNPGFENGGSGWALGFWGCTSSITTTQAHSGSYSLAQTGSTTGGSYQDLGGVVSGNSYQVSVWVRADSGTTGQAMLWVHDTAGGNSVQSAQFTPGTAWQQVSVTFTGDSTSAMRIHLYFAAGSGTIYYDDVQVQMLNPVGDTSITTHKFTGDERDAETGLDETWFRKYSSNLGRWMPPDPAGLAAVDMLNPQSWNRYAYVSNDPCSALDPLGLATCTFNISVKNSAGLNTFDLVDALLQMANIFGQTDDGKGNSVNVNFNMGGKGDYAVDFTNSSFLQPRNLFGHTGCLFGCSKAASVYVDNINNYYNTPPGPGYFGAVGAHELIAHSILGNYFDHCSDPNNIECGQNLNEQDPSATNNAVTNGQMAVLFKQCQKLHPPGTQTVGGGGSGPSSGGNDGPWAVGDGSGLPDQGGVVSVTCIYIAGVRTGCTVRAVK